MVGAAAVGRTAATLVLGGAAAAAGSVLGLGAERAAMGRAVAGEDPYANEPFGGLRGTPFAVEASDGVQLHVEVDERGSVGPTVVFAHGYALNQDSWHFQRRDLADVGRLVLYDQRSHGRSGRAHRNEVSFARLGDDLGEVVDALAPPGPVVLVGHSMGGISIMALAERRPEMFGERVRGVALVATGATQIIERFLGVRGQLARLAGHAGPAALAAASRQADLVESVRRSGSDLGYILTRRMAFARADVPPSLVEFTVGMLAGTPVGVIADFLPHFAPHDATTALAALADTEAVVVGAGGDRMTPVDHSREIVALVPHSEYVEIPDAGHMVMLEHPELVTAHIRALAARASRGTAVEIEHPGAVPVPLPRPERRGRGPRGRR